MISKVYIYKSNLTRPYIYRALFSDAIELIETLYSVSNLTLQTYRTGVVSMFITVASEIVKSLTGESTMTLNTDDASQVINEISMLSEITNTIFEPSFVDG